MPHEVIMPALGLAQDTGLIIAWSKQPGDAVSADDVLLEVETDKSAMEVPAGFEGYVAGIYAEAGEDVPVGNVIAVITAEKPETPAHPAPKNDPPAIREPATGQQPQDPQPLPQTADRAREILQPAMESGGKILASPKAKRLAAEQGLDLAQLVKAGLPQPFHVSDLDTLKTLPAPIPPGSHPGSHPGSIVSRRVTAEVPSSEFISFLDWLAGELSAGVRSETVLASFAASALRAAGNDQDIVVRTEMRGIARTYRDPDLAGLGSSAATVQELSPAVVLRDLTGTPVTSLHLGAEAPPVLTVSGAGDTYTVTCECDGGTLSAEAALALATGFAERVANPLRQLL